MKYVQPGCDVRGGRWPHGSRQRRASASGGVHAMAAWSYARGARACARACALVAAIGVVLRDYACGASAV